MKIRKGILSVLIIAISMIIFGLNSSVNAETAEQPLYLGLEQYRSSGYSYKAIEKIMWKITSYDEDGTDPDMSKTIYCIKAGPGFGSGDMGESYVGAVTVRPYTQKFDLKNINLITGNYLNALPTGGNYNSLVWVLEHCYVPGLPGSNEHKTELLTAAGIPNSQMSDDEIDIAQQLAIWYFTNNDSDDDYNMKERTFAYAVKEKADADYKDIGDKFTNGLDRNDDAITLFNYLVDQGTLNATTAPKANNTTNPITIDSSNSTIALEGNNYILGPYTLSEVVDIEYTLTASLKNGDTDVAFKILNSGKVETDLEDLIGEQFYISVNKDVYASGLQFTVKAKTFETALTYWSVTNAPTTDQPVVEIGRKETTYPTTLRTPNIPEVKLFDLALRKFITKIGITPVTISREPVITNENLAKLTNNATWTVTKTHTKQPLQVKKADTVLYTIRVYNEGEVDGYATEVTDYLPSGLKLKENSEINTEYGWTTQDGKTVVTNKLSTRLLKAFDGTTLDYADLEIECVVDAQDSTQDQSLKNVAEITAQTDASGNQITDRDSVPENLTAEQKQNYNPGTSEQGWGYQDDDDYEELLLPGKTFDLALRKFIIGVNNNTLTDASGKYIKEPNVDLTPLKNNTGKTAVYRHQKAPVGVAVGDTVIYTIRVYNEGELDGYVTEITDHLPTELEFINDAFNAKYGWSVSADGRTVKTDITSPNTALSANRDELFQNRTTGADKVLLKAFDGTTLDYIEVQIKCRVTAVENLDTIITNIADITAFTDSKGNTVRDRDSYAKDVNLPTTQQEWADYKGKNTNKSILTDSNYHYEGQYDDDDFDKLILQEFDLALRKFITGVDEEKVTNRYPVFTTDKDANGNYIYRHTKDPVLVETTDLVEYTIRIYNEGNIAGYAKQIKDNIPSGLEFVPENNTNTEYRWVMLDKDGNQTTNVEEAVSIVTDYLSKEQEATSGANLINGFDKESMATPDYKDVKVVFKVVAPNTYAGIITNTAEISDDSDENGNPIIDRDSTPNNDDKTEDDIDVEHIKLIYFDLALRKFITAVDEEEVTNRYPVFSINEEGNYIYTHTKEPVEVENGNIVTYTLRIYNEGTKAGYAKVIKDDLPEGLEFLPENSINEEYRWIMLDEEGKETEKLEEAVSISTDYLSKAQEDETGRDNLLKPFDKDTMEEPDYRDIKIAFKVTEPNTSDRILINKAQIADDEDEDGNETIDVDSTPDRWIDEEDDQDIEKVKVKYFDLALRKWVTEAIVIENGKEKVTETGHKAEDDPEEVVKVEIEKSKINKVVVKFKYKIRITNEGEIAGYATEISDYIPEGLKFVGADNPDWREAEGKIVTNKLANTLLQPGETAEVEVLLTWINGKDNMGLKVNVAEISEDKNDSDTPDIDSTPNNKVEGEDDIDDAPVILATKTGELINIQYVLLVVGALSILSLGVIFIKKYVL